MPEVVYYAYDRATGLALDLNKPRSDQTDLDTIKENLSEELLNEVNGRLPNGIPLSTSHQDWLKDCDLLAKGDLDLIKLTFVSEGAGYRNALAYYVYDQASPPQTYGQIDRLIVILPNASLINQGGYMRSGDSLYLASEGTVSSGVFTPTNWILPSGKAIGFCLFANGWNGSTVNTNSQRHFSRAVLNSERAGLNNHTVSLLSSRKPNTLIVGFEDLRRDLQSDDDFNDLIFLISATPLENIDPVSYVVPSVYGTLLVNDDLNFSSDLNDCDFNDIVATFRATVTGETGVRWLDYEFCFKHRGSFNDHTLGFTIPGLGSINRNANTRMIRQTIGGSRPLLEDLTDSISDDVIITESTKKMLPPNPHNKGFSNTVDGWNISRNRVAPCCVRILIDLGEEVDIGQFDTRDRDLWFFVDIWASGTAGQGSPVRRTITELLPAPWKYSRWGVQDMPTMFVLPDVSDFQPCKEKTAIHHAYPKFIRSLLNTSFEPVIWWTNPTTRHLAGFVAPPRVNWSSEFEK